MKVLTKGRVAPLIGAVVAIGLVSGGVGWFFATFEQVEEEVEVGYSGMARVNPFYAAELFLDEMGVPTQSRYGLGVLPPSDHTLVILTQNIEARRAMEPRLRDWIAEGGEIILFAAPPLRPREDDTEEETSDGDALLAMVGLELERTVEGHRSAKPVSPEPPAGVPDGGPAATDTPDAGVPGTDPIPAVPLPDAGPPDGGTPDGGASRRDSSPRSFGDLLRGLGSRDVRRETVFVELPNGDEPQPLAELDRTWTIVTNDFADSYLDYSTEGRRRYRPVVEVPYGRGRVTAVVDPYFMTNPVVGDHDHARLLWELMTPGADRDTLPAGAVLVIRAQAQGLWGLVWQHGWMALIALGLLILAWVWMASRRFGPTLADPDRKRRSLLEHIEATGLFLWRHGYHEELLSSARRAVRLKLAAKLGGDTELQGDALERVVSDETGMRESQVHEAFYGAQPRDKRAFTEAMKELQRIWRER